MTSGWSGYLDLPEEAGKASRTSAQASLAVPVFSPWQAFSLKIEPTNQTSLRGKESLSSKLTAKSCNLSWARLQAYVPGLSAPCPGSWIQQGLLWGHVPGSALWPSALHIVLDGNKGMKRVPCGSACVLRAWFNSAALVYALECPPSAGGAGRVPDVESVPGEPSAGNSTSQGLLVHPKTHPLPAPHSLLPLFLAQSPGLFLSVPCASITPRFMEFEAEEVMQIQKLQWIQGARPTSSSPTEAGSSVLSPGKCSQPGTHVPTGVQSKGNMGQGMTTGPIWILYLQQGH